jgi:ketosteroid isomerase-like protein
LEIERMATASNRGLLEVVFAALAQGDRRPFADAMADDFSWTITGHGPWARTWSGKTSVRQQLMAPLFSQFAGLYRNRAIRIICDGDTAAVECRGNVTTKTGKRYDNHYCYVIEMRDGKMHALTEYMDTALAEAVLTPPA